MIVRKSSVFPASRDVVFEKLQKLDTLQSIAKPYAVFSREGNEHVPVWNHDITMIPVDGNHTKYTDQVEIRAGWKTPFIWLWANAFYAHRQRKWLRLLKEERSEYEIQRDLLDAVRADDQKEHS